MVDVDLALSILQNKVRRQILERLVREPHYPMQLADLIGVSQQAIMKHLKELERGDFVAKMKVPSEKGGPPRTIYSVQKSISLRIDLGPDLFHCEQRKLPAGGPMRLSKTLPESSLKVAETVSGRKKISVGEGVSHLAELNNILEEMDAQRDAIISLHQHIRNRISVAVDADFDIYEQRAMIHSIIEAPTQRIDFTALSKELQLGQKQMNELMDEVSSRLQRQLSQRAGHIIAGPENSSLHWWLGDYKSKD
jgi:predicted transcriptional regulator